MIPYVEILEWNSTKTSLEPSFLIEPSQFWGELSYYETGAFELYAPATKNNLQLAKGQFVKIPNKSYLWVITSIQYEFNADGARMVDAKGYEAKWIVSKRIIRDPLQLPSDLEDAMSLIFDLNIGSRVNTPERQIIGLNYDFGACAGKDTEAQATRSNLYEFTLNLLKLHKIGSYSEIINGKVVYIALSGTDKSATVLFSQSLDNLISATYYTSDEEKKTNCQIVQTISETEGTGSERTTTSTDYDAYYPDEDEGASGIDRAEITISSNISLEYIPEGQTQKVKLNLENPEDLALFTTWQEQEGRSALAEKISVVNFDAQIDLRYSHYEFGSDFFIGDLVLVRDEYFGYEAKARITKYTFKQDASGYGEEAEYGTE